MFDIEDTIRLKRDVYHNGSTGTYYGIEVDGDFHELKLHEPFRTSFQPLARFHSGGQRHPAVTEHRIIIKEGREALLVVDEVGRILYIRLGGKELDFFDVPQDHEFWKFAFTLQPASNLFKDRNDDQHD